jgi:hypothetical protein
MTTGYKLINVQGPIVTPEFVTNAVSFHFEGRVALAGVTTVVVLFLIPRQCPGGIAIISVAWLWTAVSWIFVKGARPYEKEARVEQTVGEWFGVHYKVWTKYPWWSFIPDITILTAMVIHSGAGFSVFIPMFLVMGTLGDHALIGWKKRRLFLPLFIFLPYTLVILLSTPLGRSSILTPYFQWMFHEEFWAPLSLVSYRLAFCMWMIFLGATWLTSYVLRNLLLTAIKATVEIHTATTTTIDLASPTQGPVSGEQ